MKTRQLLKYGTLFLILTGFLVLNASAASIESRLKRIHGLYSEGNYQASLSKLKKIRTKDLGVQATVEFWKGLCHTRLQNFSSAVRTFNSAIRKGVKAKSAHFELGQAEFALKNGKGATKAFKNSIKAGYKKDASFYYLGQLALDGGNKKKAISLFQKAKRVAPSGSPVISAVMYQLAELEGGKAVQASKLQFSQTIAYDTNVVFQAKESDIAISNTNSFVSQSALSGSHPFDLGGIVLRPEAAMDFIFHTRRSLGRVVQNDAVNVSPGLVVSYGHRLFGNNANVDVSGHFDYSMRDPDQDKAFEYYSSNIRTKIAETLEWNPKTSSTIDFQYENYINADSDYSATILQFGYTHRMRMSSRNSYSLRAEAQLLDAEDSFNDLAFYRLGYAYHMKDFYFGFSFHPDLSVALVDTKNQSTSRGTEWAITPSMRFRKSFSKNLGMELNYTFIKRFSEDNLHFEYSKHLVGLSGIVRL